MILKAKADKSRERYLMGDCHSMAIALSRLTGEKMVSVARKWLLPEEEWCGDEESDKYDSEHCHAAIQLSNGILVDVTGAFYFESKSEKWLWSCPENASEPYLMEFEPEGEEDLASYYADYDEEIIQIAIEDAKRWNLDKLIEEIRVL